MQKTAYAGWPNCLKLSNGEIDLVATTDVGPRIIRLGFVGAPNLFKEYPDQVGRTGAQEWMIYGGHRLWHSPEDKVRTYSLDNSPIEAKYEGGTLYLNQPVEPDTGILKQMEVTLDPNAAVVTVRHKLTNTNLWPVELAAWALTVMDVGTRAIIPHPTKAHPDLLLPNWTLTLWPYTNMMDPRVTWGEKYIMLQQNPQATTKFKLGLSANDGWCAAANKGFLFVKRFRYQEGATYPDWGCSVETFTNNDMLELETVGPLKTLEHGQTLEHIERWYLFRDVPTPKTEDDVDNTIIPLVSKTK